MYAGRLVEMGSTAEVLTSPLHHYTAAPVSSFPNVSGDKRPLAVLDGEPPDLVTPPAGCPLHPRCPAVTEICRTAVPPRVNRETNGQPAGILRVIGWLQRGQRRDRTGLIHAALPRDLPYPRTFSGDRRASFTRWMTFPLSCSGVRAWGLWGNTVAAKQRSANSW